MDELVKRLREDAPTALANCDFDFVEGWMREAADAIEELNTYKVCFDNIVRMGGWWLVGQDGNLYRMNVPMNWPPEGTKTVEVFPLPEPPKEKPTCKDCQRECQMIGLDMEACASYEPPKEETND